MLKKHILLFVAVLGGAGGIALRRFQWSTAFEPGPLPIPFAPATLAIGFFSLAILVLICLLSPSSKQEEHAAQRSVYRPSFFVLLFTWASAALTLWSAVSFWNGARMSTKPNLLLYLFIGLLAASAASIFLLGLRRYQGKQARSSVALLLPAYAICLFLMVSYQGWAGDPFVVDYVFALFAIISSLLAHYFIASHIFYKPRRSWIYIFGGMSIFLSLIALAGSNFTSGAAFSLGGISSAQLLFAAQVLYFVPTLLLFTQNNPSMHAIETEVVAAPIAESSNETPSVDSIIQEVNPDVT